MRSIDVTGEPRDFKFGTLTNITASPTLPIKNLPWKGRGLGQLTRFRILHPM